MNHPLVSIVTPSFNAGDFIEPALQSLLGQNYPHLECLVIDGGSTDTTLEILQRYQPAITWLSEPDNGQADAINKGFKRAQGEIIGWLNADDFYQPGTISAAVTYLLAHPEIDLVYGNFNLVNAAGQVIRPHYTPEFSPARLLYEAIIPQTSMFFRRRILDELGGVDPALHYVMDWEFTLRLAQRYRVAHVAEIWGNFRITAGTKSVRQPEKFWPETLAVLEQAFPQAPAGLERALREARLTAQLQAGLEFARMGQLASAKNHLEQALDLNKIVKRHAAVIAAGLYRAAVYPWHSAFEPHPLAGVALDNLLYCLNNGREQQRIAGLLQIYRAAQSIKTGQLNRIKPYLNHSRNLLSIRDWLDWQAARMTLAALIR